MINKAGITLLLSGLLLGTAAVAQKQAAPKKKYNVLMLIADDLRPEISCYDPNGSKTPNIDEIAKRAIRFDNAYAQYPVCNCSRTSFLTGRYPTQTGVMDNNTYFRRIHPDWVTLPQYFMNNGYVTLRSGKIFHGGIDDMVSWTEGGEPTNPAITERGNNARPARANGGAGGGNGNANGGNAGRRANVSSTGADLGEGEGNGSTSANSSSDRIIVLQGDGEEHGDYKTATRAIEMMDKYKDKPFFLACGFVKPHSPPTAPQKFFDLYDVGKVPLPVDYATTPAALPGFPPISIASVNSDLFIGRPSTPESAREMKRAYWASTSFMDANVGRVMAALKRNHLEDNTIVLFFGDHGYHLGEKGKWSKGYSLYEIGLRVPLLVAIPGAKQAACKQIISMLDIYPTLAELCGLPKPPDQEGHSFVAQLKNPKAKRDYPSLAVVDYHGKTGKSVRVQGWHYVEWEDGAEGNMLLEHPKDSLELHNLANDPAYAKKVAELKAMIKLMPDTRVLAKKN